MTGSKLIGMKVMEILLCAFCTRGIYEPRNTKEIFQKIKSFQEIVRWQYEDQTIKIQAVRLPVAVRVA